MRQERVRCKVLWRLTQNKIGKNTPATLQRNDHKEAGLNFRQAKSAAVTSGEVISTHKPKSHNKLSPGKTGTRRECLRRHRPREVAIST